MSQMAACRKEVTDLRRQVRKEEQSAIPTVNSGEGSLKSTHRPRLLVDHLPSWLWATLRRGALSKLALNVLEPVGQ